MGAELASFYKNILCMDVDYRDDNSAIAAGIMIDDIFSDQYSIKKTVFIESVAEYIPGEFYRRELPCLIQLIKSLSTLPDLFIIDGFVYLDSKESLGLGGHLFNFFNCKIPVIGVAKTNFMTNSESSKIIRGESVKPLFITSIGVDQDTAAQMIFNMHGDYRVPTILKNVDSLCRQAKREDHSQSI